MLGTVERIGNVRTVCLSAIVVLKVKVILKVLGVFGHYRVTVYVEKNFPPEAKVRRLNFDNIVPRTHAPTHSRRHARTHYGT